MCSTFENQTLYWFVQTHKQLLWDSGSKREHTIRKRVKIMIFFFFAQGHSIIFVVFHIVSAVHFAKQHSWNAADWKQWDAALFKPN